MIVRYSLNVNMLGGPGRAPSGKFSNSDPLKSPQNEKVLFPIAVLHKKFDGIFMSQVIFVE